MSLPLGKEAMSESQNRRSLLLENRFQQSNIFVLTVIVVIVGQ